MYQLLSVTVRQPIIDKAARTEKESAQTRVQAPAALRGDSPETTEERQEDEPSRVSNSVGSKRRV